MNKPDYDIIISGGGAAGLSLLWHLLESPWGRQQRILIVEREAKLANDRTWGYWSRTNEPFDALASQSFAAAEFFGGGKALQLDLGPYRYRVIEGLNFYQAVRKRISAAENVAWLQAEVRSLSYAGDLPQLHIQEGSFTASWIFNSVFLKEELQRIQPSTLNLMQHFKGWVIQTDAPVFAPDKVRLFDFRTPQQGSLRFMYLVPQAPERALVEYTLFSGQLLEPAEYEKALTNYLKEVIGLKTWQILDEEWGIIPMTSHRFPASIGPRIRHIGSVGGASKASTGYTFRRIQQQCRQIVRALERGEAPPKPLLSGGLPAERFRLYDAALLNILDKRGERGEAVMSQLFANNPIGRVFRFLDEETHLLEELQIMNSVQRRWFIRSLLNLGLKLPF